MAPRKPFLLRMDPKVLNELRAWAEQDLRSLNGQIEFLLRRLLQERKKGKRAQDHASADDATSEDQD